MCFSLPSIKCSVGPPSLRLLPSTFSLSNGAQRFDYRALGSSRKLGTAAEHLNGLMVARNAFVGWSLNFRVRILLKGAVKFAWSVLLLVVSFLPWNEILNLLLNLTSGTRWKRIFLWTVKVRIRYWRTLALRWVFYLYDEMAYKPNLTKVR